MVYLDHASAMPVDPRVLAYLRDHGDALCGNPSSLHSVGLAARRELEAARGRVAALINAPVSSSIVFTAGATEANNLAIRGTAERNQKHGKTIAVSAIEHISIINPAKYLVKQGFELATVPVDADGLVSPDVLAGLMTPDTTVVSINYANDEIGTIEPVRELARLVHEEEHRYLHVNATAAGGRIPIDVQSDEIDLLTLSSSDLGGPRGAGALYVAPGVRLQTVMPGGGQERGLRSGTENLPAIAGMGEAARIAGGEMEQESRRQQKIRDALIAGIGGIGETYLTGHPRLRLPNHASFRFGRIEGESILLNMDTLFGIQVATGSACTSQTLEPSHVLLAIGLTHEEAHGSMIMTTGRDTAEEAAPGVIDAVRQTVERLRALSPL
ncbi:MAG: cysteine desulfurase [Methanomicrobiales archaeon]|nr:cysteine desulfurase [Methanomicrobiales archaeon]